MNKNFLKIKMPGGSAGGGGGGGDVEASLYR